MWVLGIEPRSSVRITGTINCWAISQQKVLIPYDFPWYIVESLKSYHNIYYSYQFRCLSEYQNLFIYYCIHTQIYMHTYTYTSNFMCIYICHFIVHHIRKYFSTFLWLLFALNFLFKTWSFISLSLCIHFKDQHDFSFYWKKHISIN